MLLAVVGLTKGVGCCYQQYVLNRRREVLKLKCCFTSTETVGLLGTGAQDGHLDVHTAPKLWRFC